MTPQELEFLKEISEVCRKHKMHLDGCGCCGSPYLSDNRPNGEYVQRVQPAFNDGDVSWI